jgi:hypothetical protein
VLAHSRDKSLLTDWRLGRIGEKRHPSGAIQGIVDSRRELSVERVGDLFRSTSETVAGETPACRAMSFTVARIRLLSSRLVSV